jgi:hypothetical protein
VDDLVSDSAFWRAVAEALLKRFPVELREDMTAADAESVADAATQIMWNVAHNRSVEAWSWSIATRLATFRPGLVFLARRTAGGADFLLTAMGELHPEPLGSNPPSGEYAVVDVARLESNRDLWRAFTAALADLVPDTDRSMRNDVRFHAERKATALLHELAAQQAVDADDWRIVSTYATPVGFVCFQAQAPDGRRFFFEPNGVLRMMEPEWQAIEEESYAELQRPFIP